MLRKPAPETPRRPYKLVCVSLYLEDIARLEALVAELKRRGHTRMSKSRIVRLALAEVDLAKLAEPGPKATASVG
ncbi:MAG TPA: hypothetical protein VKN99_08110 [Polyangia bacterium]|nr:hypothetical protein [Polyangia bacterium]